MNDLRRKTMYLLTEHKKVFNQNPAKRDLMDHIKALQARVDILEKIVEGGDLTTTFETAKVGDRVWSKISGWGEIHAIDASVAYPISVRFPVGGLKTYTAGGLYDYCDVSQSLFWDEVVIVAPVKPLPDLVVDTKVMVWKDHGLRVNRHFSHFDHRGVMHTFADGRTSFTGSGSTVQWPNWELAE